MQCHVLVVKVEIIIGALFIPLTLTIDNRDYMYTGLETTHMRP